MIKPQKPENEEQRLNELNSLHIMDTHSEERFDRISRVAQRLFDVPIVSVSLIDEEREWYKSRNGLLLSEVPRDISLGAHVILQKELMIVEDAKSDERFMDNPLVLGEPDIGFYLGCPLRIKEQFNIGTLSLIDHKPRHFNSIDLNTIKELATTIESELINPTRATIDEVTQISNCDGFILVGKKIIQHCTEVDKDVLLIYFYLDKLKSYEPDEEKEAVKIFSQQLLKNFRRVDAIGRLGRDIFCVLCSGMSKTHFSTVITRFEKKLALIKTNYPIEFTTGYIEYKHNSINYLIEETYEKIYGLKGLGSPSV